MSIWGSLANGLGSIGKAAMTVVRSPILGTAVKAVPVVGTVATVADAGLSLYNMANSGGRPPAFGGGLPALPASGVGTARLGGARLPAPAGSPVGQIQVQHQAQIAALGGRHGRRPPVEGWNALINSGVTLGSAYFRYKVSGPAGYVAVHNPLDHSQVVLAPKEDARRAGLWRPHAKPPISVRQWHAIKHAKAALKHLKKVNKAGDYIHAASHGHRKGAHAAGCSCIACRGRKKK